MVRAIEAATSSHKPKLSEAELRSKYGLSGPYLYYPAQFWPHKNHINLLHGLKALRAHSLEAFIYDKPLLAWTVQQGFGSSIELIDTTFDPQEYAFAVPSNSPLERTINVAILEAVHSDWWEQTTFRYLGSR